MKGPGREQCRVSSEGRSGLVQAGVFSSYSRFWIFSHRLVGFLMFSGLMFLKDNSAAETLLYFKWLTSEKLVAPLAHSKVVLPLTQLLCSPLLLPQADFTSVLSWQFIHESCRVVFGCITLLETP